MTSKPIIERAYELARSGACASYSEVLRKLSREGYYDASSHLDGRLIRSQIVAMISHEAPGQSVGRLRRRSTGDTG